MLWGAIGLGIIGLTFSLLGFLPPDALQVTGMH